MIIKKQIHVPIMLDMKDEFRALCLHHETNMSDVLQMYVVHWIQGRMQQERFFRCWYPLFGGDDAMHIQINEPLWNAMMNEKDRTGFHPYDFFLSCIEESVRLGSIDVL